MPVVPTAFLQAVVLPSVDTFPWTFIRSHLSSMFGAKCNLLKRYHTMICLRHSRAPTDGTTPPDALVYDLLARTQAATAAQRR
jgi:hypothetical protein